MAHDPEKRILSAKWSLASKSGTRYRLNARISATNSEQHI